MQWLRKLFGRDNTEFTDTCESVQNSPELPEPYPPLPEIDLKAAPSQGFSKPHFRFFPDAYSFREEGKLIFERQEGPCHCCGMRDILVYLSRIYWVRRDNPVICAQCIADGKVGRLLHKGDRYAMHDCELDGIAWDDPIALEINQRTPGFSTFNPFTWATMNGKPMAFVGYGEDVKWGDIPAARSAVSQIWNEAGVEDVFPSPYLLIFRELDGENFRAVLDLD